MHDATTAAPADPRKIAVYAGCMLDMWCLLHVDSDIDLPAGLFTPEAPL
ncbi:MAG: hypothetical protein ACRDYU_10050 [Actinomycetes bacterium]